MKQVAKTVRNIEASEMWKRIMDPADQLDDLVEVLRDHWSYDLYSRRPGPALVGEDGALKPTDLDLACFLSALSERGAIIDLPKYERRRPMTVREGERVVSADHRHGKVLGLTSNREVFSFSVKISDLNVVFNSEPCSTCGGTGIANYVGAARTGNTTCDTCKGEKVVKAAHGDGESAGAPRNFMLVDVDGTWHDGWKQISFSPNRKENEFLEGNDLWTGDSVFFENFIHPNRWTSFYGRWYVLTKLLIERLRSEVHHCGIEIKNLQGGGFTLPLMGPGAERDWGKAETVGASKTIEVVAFEAELDANVPRDFAKYPRSQAGLVAAKLRRAKLLYDWLPALSFPVRATELAFARAAGILDKKATTGTIGEISDIKEPFPSWFQGAKWTRGYKIKRTTWNRLVLAPREPFMQGLGLRYRVSLKSEKVAA